MLGFLNGLICTKHKQTFVVTNSRFLVLSYWRAFHHYTCEKQKLVSHNLAEFKAIKAVKGPFALAYLRLEGNQNNLETPVLKDAINLYENIPALVKKSPLIIDNLDVLKRFIKQKIFLKDSVLSSKVFSNGTYLSFGQLLKLRKGQPIYGEDGAVYSSSVPRIAIIIGGFFLVLWLVLILLAYAFLRFR